MKTFRKIALIALAVIIASCTKNYRIAGTWISVKDFETDEWNNVDVTVTETFSEDGMFKGNMSMPLGSAGIGANGVVKGSYEIIGDSLIIYYKKFTIMGRDIPVKDNGRTGRKIIKHDENTFIYSIEGKKTEMKRIKGTDKN